MTTLALAALLSGCTPVLGQTPSSGSDTSRQAGSSGLASGQPGGDPSTDLGAGASYRPEEPRLTAAAKRRDGAGAAAFTQFFFELVGFSWGMPQSGLIDGYSEQDCQACANYAGEAERLLSTHQRFASDPLAVETVKVLRKTADGYQLRAGVEQLPARIYNINGSLARKQAGEALTMVVETSWGAGGWRVASVVKT